MGNLPEIKSILSYLNTKSDQNIHQDASNCTFLKSFLAG